MLDNEKPDGVLVQFGGQTPLKLARALEAAGYPIWGTSPESIDLAEDRGRFGRLLGELGLAAPPHAEARDEREALEAARRIGYPLVVRPSYVLGGLAMAIVFDEGRLAAYVREAMASSPEHPVLIDRFLDDAVELDVDALSMVRLPGSAASSITSKSRHPPGDSSRCCALEGAAAPQAEIGAARGGSPKGLGQVPLNSSSRSHGKLLFSR